MPPSVSPPPHRDDAPKEASQVVALFDLKFGRRYWLTFRGYGPGSDRSHKQRIEGELVAIAPGDRALELQRPDGSTFYIEARLLRAALPLE